MIDVKPFQSAEYKRRTKNGTKGRICCICGRKVDCEAEIIAIDHERGEFYFGLDCPPNVSGYPIGPECFRKWRKVQQAAINA